MPRVSLRVTLTCPLLPTAMVIVEPSADICSLSIAPWTTNAPAAISISTAAGSIGLRLLSSQWPSAVMFKMFSASASIFLCFAAPVQSHFL